MPAITPKIRLLIVDDHPIVREGLRNMALSSTDIELVEVCSNGEAALRIVSRQRVDVMLLDMRMKPTSGVDVLRQLQQLDAPCKALILSSYELEEEVFQAVAAGACGYLTKTACPSDILCGIAAVHQGQRVFPAYLLWQLEQRGRKKSLSPRELGILEMLAKGLTNKEIAQIHRVSQFTVRNQISSLSAKLDASDRTEAVRIAIEQGIIVL